MDPVEARVAADWRPLAGWDAVRLRARVLAQARAFFAERGVLEVDTPALSSAANSDPALQSLASRARGRGHYLHTSPEFAMKRMLAAGSGDIYQVCHVFRDGERGRYHNPEFTLLEWYRVGVTMAALIDEVLAFIAVAGDGTLGAWPVHRWRYRALFEHTLGIDPLEASAADLRACAERQPGPVPALRGEDPLPWLDWLMAACVQPALPPRALTVIEDYPAGQAALARLSHDRRTAMRFEVFCGTLELANGYQELDDPVEQRRRFERDLAVRRARGLDVAPLDERLLAALAHLPPCCGVALGLDRLLMRLAGVDSIDAVLAFPLERA